MGLVGGDIGTIFRHDGVVGGHGHRVGGALLGDIVALFLVFANLKTGGIAFHFHLSTRTVQRFSEWSIFFRVNGDVVSMVRVGQYQPRESF